MCKNMPIQIMGFLCDSQKAEEFIFKTGNIQDEPVIFCCARK